MLPSIRPGVKRGATASFASWTVNIRLWENVHDPACPLGPPPVSLAPLSGRRRLVTQRGRGRSLVTPGFPQATEPRQRPAKRRSPPVTYSNSPSMEAPFAAKACASQPE